MKAQNVMVLLVIIALSVLTAIFSVLPDNLSTFLMAFGASFCFWFLMLIGAFDFEKESNYSKEGWNEKYNR